MRLGTHIPPIYTDNRRLEAELAASKKAPQQAAAPPPVSEGERVKRAVAETKLECAGKLIEFLMAQRTAGGEAGPSGLATPGTGPSPVPMNPFAEFFKVSQ